VQDGLSLDRKSSTEHCEYLSTPEGNIKMCLIGCRLDSIGAGMGEWRAIVKTVMELLGSVKYMEFLDHLATNC
jgi:hypothetical protein